MRNLKTIIALAILGILDSAASLISYFSSTAASYCTFGPHFSCDLVYSSSYARIAGVPVALIGVAGYVLLGIMAFAARKNMRMLPYLFFAAAGGLAFSLYLAYVEAFVLDVWCVYCVISLAIITSIALFAARLRA
jgi:vitamin-K-epoxide reductase (warfarin-sensitive)